VNAARTASEACDGIVRTIGGSQVTTARRRFQIEVSSQSSLQLQRALTRRFGLALLAGAAILIASYVTTSWKLRSNKVDGYIINISGMQRMLSQRIALLALELERAPTAESADEIAEELARAAQRMASNHRQLSSGEYEGHAAKSPSAATHAMYFGVGGVDREVQQYLDASRRILAAYREHGAGAPEIAPLAKQLSDTQGALLGNLDRMAFHFQREHEGVLEHFVSWEFGALFLRLAVLVLEAAFVFPLARLLARKTVALEVANSELIEFSYRISHDLRAPVATARGLAETGQMSLEVNDVGLARKAFEHIATSLSKLEATVDDVIGLTKSKLVGTAPEDVDLVRLIDESLAKLSLPDVAGALQVRRSIDLRGPIRARRLLVQQALENLISNASKYRDPQKADPYIAIEAREDASGTTIAVEDNGIGIPPTHHGQVFQMFRRFHPKVASGSGLGLYIVAQNARLMGGSAHYVPRDGGSRFELVIPKARAAA